MIGRSAFLAVATLGGGLIEPARVPAPVLPPPGLTAFVDVTVLPMDQPRVPRLLRHQTVLVRGERIAALGPTAHVRVPSGATVVDGRGRYLIPGLGNMHTHLQVVDSILPRPVVERLLLSYLAEGVTTVRNMNGRPWHVALRGQVARGELLGPRIYTAGPAFGTDEQVSTPAAAVQVAAAQHAAGYDFVKLYAAASPEIFDSLMAAAARLHLPVAGHVPEAVGLERALAAHMASTEHLYGYLEALKAASDVSWWRTDWQVRLDPATISRLARETRRAGVWTCPTLYVLYDTYIHTTAPQRMVQALSEAGAGLLLGTDGTPFGGRVPVVEELQALVAAGLTPYQALETGTRNVAAFLGTLDSSGTVAVGKRADLVLVAGNPLEDVRRVAQPAGVMVGGQWLPQAELAARLAKVGGPDSVPLPPLATPLALPSAAAPLVLQGVTVIDVATGQRLPDRTVVIAGTKIQAMGRRGQVRVSRAARVVDARGQYLIPGLWDLHAHNVPGIFGDSATARSVHEAADRYAIYLAYGVTGVRDMGSSLPLDSVHAWRRRVAAGHHAGPRLLVSGPYVDAEKPPSWGALTATLPAALRATTPAEARWAVDTLKAAGADVVKVHENATTREVFFALLAEARRVGLPVAGHLPKTVTMAEASDSGMQSIEHRWGFTGPCVQYDSTGGWSQDSAGVANQQACAALIGKFLRNGTWLSPTQDSGSDVRFVRAVRPFGLPFVIGTDLPLTGTALDLKGAPSGVHSALAFFVKAGLTPAEALQTATLNPAKLWRATDSLGTVAPGKLADLVLLDADPLADIANTTAVRAVVANGRYYDRAALDALVAAVRGRAGAGPGP